MRIIGGKFRSRRLKSLKGLSLRPTSDRLRETLFNILSPLIEGARFADLFAGTGAVGIEAISRGASFVLFVENHVPAVTIIRANLASLDAKNAAELAIFDVFSCLKSRSAASTPQPFDIIFLDPPYAAASEYKRVLGLLGGSPLVSAQTVVIAEHRKSFSLDEFYGKLQRFRHLQQGDAALSFYRQAEAEEVEADAA